ncbi:hypothetical protein T439DRAFT_317713 [Meredithblackwellia eburnea MCA 4105]
MSAANSTTQDLEKAEHSHSEGRPIGRTITPGGHPADYSQPAIPAQHRVHGNPSCLGLVSFGCGFFLSSALTLHTRGVQVPNVVVPVLILYGGISQSLVGWFEMYLGNTFGATVFGSYGAFNLTYGALYLPAFGVISAYTLPDGTLSPQFSQAIGLYLIAWFIVTMLFIIGALRSSAAVLSTLVFTALAFLTLAINSFTGSDASRVAGGAFGMAATFCSFWAAICGFWSKDATFAFLTPSPIDLSSKDN